MIFLRSLIFNLGYFLSIIPLGFHALISFAFPYEVRYRQMRWWGYFVVYWAKWIVGIHYQIQGMENVPKDRVGIFVSNHQSSWENIAFRIFFPRQTWVLKKSLMYIPFAGWALYALRAIAIDRAKGREALKQLLQKGKKHLKNNTWIFIYPEGTRRPYGQLGEYKIGAAYLASHTGAPIVCIVHDAGKCWPRNSFLKYPGTVNIIVSPVMETQGLSAKQINEKILTWTKKHLPVPDSSHSN